jgi:electron transfer flavoprotein beta subunit
MDSRDIALPLGQNCEQFKCTSFLDCSQKHMVSSPKKEVSLMKIFVAIKRVVDYSVKIRVKADGSGVETTNVKMSMNPFDEIAVEEAIRLKEAGIASEVVVVSIGTDACQETLRTALAMGADRAILIETSIQMQPLTAAKLLKKITDQEDPQIVLLGKQAIDDDCNQTGQMLAALLKWPQGTFASKLVIANNKATVTREVDGGLETLQLALPAVITTDLRLNQPRYISLPNIMKAKQKPLQKIPTDLLGIDLKPHFILQKVESPAPRKAGVKVKDVQELVDKLRNEAGVL